MFFHFLFLPYYYYFHMDRKIPRKEAFLSSVDGGENEGCQARAACDVMTTAGGTAATRPPPMRLQYYSLCCPFFETDEEHDRPIAWYRKKRAEEVVVDDDIANKLRVVSSEKEHVFKELNAKIRESDNLKAENEKYAAIIDEKTTEANREIKSLRAELDLSKQAKDLAIAEVQTVTKVDSFWML